MTVKVPEDIIDVMFLEPMWPISEKKTSGQKAGPIDTAIYIPDEGQKFNPHHDARGRFASGGGGGGGQQIITNPDVQKMIPNAGVRAQVFAGDSETGYLKLHNHLEDAGTGAMWLLPSGGAISRSAKGAAWGGHNEFGKRAGHKDATPFLKEGWVRAAHFGQIQIYETSAKPSPHTLGLIQRHINGIKRNLPDYFGVQLQFGNRIREFRMDAYRREGTLLGVMAHGAYEKAFAQKAGPIDTAIYIPDEDILAREIAAWLPTFTNSWYDTIEVTTRSRLRDVLAQAVREGQSIDWVYKSIEPLFGATRALRISQTEMTRIFAKGQDMIYAEAGVDTVEWRTVRDFAVCSDCAPLHGKVFPRSSGPRPPNHVICRCFMAPHIAEEAAAEKFL